MPLRPACLAVLVLLAALPLAAGEDAADLAGRKARLEQEVRELRALEAAGAAGSLLLDGIGRSLPELAWLEEVSLEAGRVRVSGRAFSTNAVAKLIENLDAIPEFDQTALLETTLAEPADEEEEPALYSFEIAFRLSPPPQETPVEVAALERERDALSRRLARREDVPRILAELRAMAGDLDFGSSSFVEARTGSAKAARIDVDLASTFHGLATLLDRLKTLSALVALDELTIRQELSEKGTIAASFRLRIPLRPPAP
jgi:hypothetical protein